MRRNYNTLRNWLSLEQLESREVPVVGLAGAGNLAPPTATGGDFDGAVYIASGNNRGTGAILSTPMYVLTAAHVVGTNDGTGQVKLPAGWVEFEVVRGQGALEKIRVNVPEGKDFLSVEPGWDPTKPADDKDIAIVTLPDQNPATQAAGRVMIAPYQKTAWGGNRYNVYAGNPLNKQFLMVGYGQTGAGPDGNHDDRVDRVTITNPIAGAGNDFTVTIGNGVDAKTTAKLSQKNTTAAQLAAELDRIDPPAPGRPSYYLVHKVEDGVWDIRFTNDRTRGNDLGGVTAITRYNGAQAPGVAVAPVNRWAGTQTIGTRRSGENEFDRTRAGNANILEFDFDNKAAGVSAFGTAGLGGTESDVGPGDSGGPGLIRNGAVPEIAGVASFIHTFPVGGGGANPDVTQYVDKAGSLSPDSSIGEYGGYTHVQPYMATYVSPLITQKVDLILDMNYQAYGKSVAGELIKINVTQVGGKLKIEVDGPVDNLDGVYAEIDAATVKSLTIRGTDDKEIVTITGPLQFAAGSKSIIFEGGAGNDELIVSGLEGAAAAGDIGSIYFNGGAGTDQITVDDSAAVGDGNTYTLEPPDQAAATAGWTQQVSRTTPVNGQPPKIRPSVYTNTAERITLKTGGGNDVIQIRSVDASFNSGIVVYGGGGDDELTVGDATNGISNVKSTVFFDGGVGTDRLVVEDSASAVARTYEVGADDPPTTWNGKIRRTDLAVSTTFGRTEKVEVIAGSKADTFTVTTLDASVSGGLTLKGNGDDDKFTVGSPTKGLDDIKGVVNVDGGAGKNTLVADDAKGTGGKAAYKISKGQAAGSGNLRKQATPNAPFIEFENISTPPQANGNSIALLGRADGTDLVVAGLWADTGLQFVGNTGDDLLVLDADTSGGGVAARVSFLGGDGTDAVQVVSGNYQTGDPATVAAGRYALAFSPLETLIVDGGLLDVATAESVGVYDQDGGTLTGSGTLTVAQLLQWLGGVMQGSGTTVGSSGSSAILGVGGGGAPLTLTRTLDVSGTTQWADAPIVGGAGTLINRGTLNGKGQLTGTLINTATLYPGWAGTAGLVTVAGPFSHTAGVITYDLGYSGASDQVAVTGVGSQVTLGSSLAITTPTTFTPAGSYTLISNLSDLPVSGTFLGLPEGATVSVGGYTYTISYVGGPAIPNSSQGNDVVLTAASTATVGNYVWLDQSTAAGFPPFGNGNGIQDEGPFAGMSGIQVQLLGTAGQVLSTTTTNSSGAYQFAGLVPGQYQLRFLLPAGGPTWQYQFTTRYAGSPLLDSDADTLGFTAPFTLAVGETNTTFDAGLRRVAGGPNPNPDGGSSLMAGDEESLLSEESVGLADDWWHGAIQLVDDESADDGFGETGTAIPQSADEWRDLLLGRYLAGIAPLRVSSRLFANLASPLGDNWAWNPDWNAVWVG